MSKTETFLRGRWAKLDANERGALEGAVSHVRELPPRTSFIRQGDDLTTSTLLLEGLMGRYLDDHRGNRQLIAVHIAGDFVDLHGLPLGRLDHDVGTLSACRIAIFQHRTLRTLLEQMPSLWMRLWYATMLDAAMHRQWVFRLGRMDAVGRVSNFMCELDARMAAVGLSDGRRFSLPLTQIDVAEMCGLTHIHVNRVLRQLREEGLMEMRAGQVELLDPPRLARRGHFDPSYLFLDPAIPTPDHVR